MASLCPTAWLPSAWLLLLLAGLGLIIAILSKNSYRYWALLGLFLFLGLWRYSLNSSNDNPFAGLERVPYQGRVIIGAEPRWLATGQELMVRAQDNPQLRILVKTDYNAIYQEGQVLDLKCNLNTSASQAHYFKIRAVTASCYRGELTLVDDQPQSWLVRIRTKIAQVVGLGLNEPEAGLANAMLFGIKQDLSPRLMTTFSRTGLSHLIAISGMNISLIIWLVIILALFIGLGRRQAFWFAVVFVSLFTILVGASASVVRAAIMGFLVLAAAQLGRLPKALHILVLSATVMVACEPTWLLYDLGFQLSFLAILGLSWYYNPLLQLCERPIAILAPWLQPWAKLMAQILSATLSAQLLTLPLLVVRFGMISIISLVANLLTVWLMPLIMGLGLVAVAWSALTPSWALIIFLPLQLVLKYLIWINGSLSALPWATLTIAEPWRQVIWLWFLPVLWLKKYFDTNSEKDDNMLLM